MENYTSNQEEMQSWEILHDVVVTKSGKKKVQPWRGKRMKNMTLSKSMHRLADTMDESGNSLDQQFAVKLHKKANRIWWCGVNLEFTVDSATLQKTLQKADFCRERLCVMCNWRRSIKVFWQVSKVMDVVQIEYPNLEPIFLTMTVRNCSGDDLSKTLDQMFEGWKLMLNHRKFNRLVVGWFRALEVTCNPDKRITPRLYEKRKKFYDRQGLKVGDVNPVYDTYHPHFHVVLLVNKSYFKKGNRDYMHTADWVSMWRGACKLDYDPVCDIRKTQRTESGRVKVAEVAKYTLKDVEFIREGQPEWMDKTIGELGKALKGRRLVAFGGVMKKISQQLKMSDPVDGDLVHIDDESIRSDVALMIEEYIWDFGLLDYFRQPDVI